MSRTGSAERKTGETYVRVRLELDGTGQADVSTGVGFLDHLLHLLAHHSGMDLAVEAKGDTWVDDHHTVEDTGLVLGRAFDEALGDRTGLVRFADASAPLIEALSTAVVDLGARSHLTCNLGPMPEKIGTFDTELVREFFQALSTHGGITLHVDRVRGINSHHIAEAAFKAVARALRMAVEPDPRAGDALPSTKGVL